MTAAAPETFAPKTAATSMPTDDTMVALPADRMIQGDVPVAAIPLRPRVRRRPRHLIYVGTDLPDNCGERVSWIFRQKPAAYACAARLRAQGHDVTILFGTVPAWTTVAP